MRTESGTKFFDPELDPLNPSQNRAPDRKLKRTQSLRRSSTKKSVKEKLIQRFCFHRTPGLSSAQAPQAPAPRPNPDLGPAEISQPLQSPTPRCGSRSRSIARSPQN